MRTLEVYDPGSDTWRIKPPMTVERQTPTAVAVNGSLYVIGGLSRIDYSSINESYRPGDVWVTKSPMPTGRGGLVAGVVGGKIYAVGGFAGIHLAVNQAYTPGTGLWTSRAPLPQTRMDANGAGVINGVLYVPGGVGNGLMQKTLYAYTASSNTWTTKATMPAVGGGERQA